MTYTPVNVYGLSEPEPEDKPVDWSNPTLYLNAVETLNLGLATPQEQVEILKEKLAWVQAEKIEARTRLEAAMSTVSQAKENYQPFTTEHRLLYDIFSQLSHTKDIIRNDT